MLSAVCGHSFIHGCPVAPVDAARRPNNGLRDISACVNGATRGRASESCAIFNSVPRLPTAVLFSRR
jgi:hypothetical protein